MDSQHTLDKESMNTLLKDKELDGSMSSGSGSYQKNLQVKTQQAYLSTNKNRSGWKSDGTCSSPSSTGNDADSSGQCSGKLPSLPPIYKSSSQQLSPSSLLSHSNGNHAHSKSNSISSAPPLCEGTLSIVSESSEVCRDEDFIPGFNSTEQNITTYSRSFSNKKSEVLSSSVTPITQVTLPTPIEGQDGNFSFNRTCSRCSSPNSDKSSRQASLDSVDEQLRCSQTSSSRQASFEKMCTCSLNDVSCEKQEPLNKVCDGKLHSGKNLESTPSLTTSGKERKESRESKKTRKPWYNMLSPTYKSRSADLRRLFKDLPQDERLIVDYSCALQKDILVHGRLYVTPNFLCFYSKIFGWETFVAIKCKVITQMTKEKTALVIPNAIQINTESEKHFFTTFAARDKAYLMLFRIWQNALMDQQISSSELWQWIHSSYGEELGLTSDDDDYVAPSTTEEDSKVTIPVVDAGCGTIPAKLLTQDSLEDSVQSENIADCSAVSAGGDENLSLRQWPLSSKDSCEQVASSSSPTKQWQPKVRRGHSQQTLSDSGVSPGVAVSVVSHKSTSLPTDLSDSSQTENEHDVVVCPWQSNAETNQKLRQVTYTLTLPTNSFGPKVSHVTETQVLSQFSKHGEIYTVDAEACNAGIPYADSFSVCNHWCLTRESAGETRLTVWTQVKYKKGMWGFMKGVIDRNAYSGVESLLNDINIRLSVEADKTIQKTKRRRRRRAPSCKVESDIEDVLPVVCDKGLKDLHKSTQFPQRKLTFPSLSSMEVCQPSNERITQSSGAEEWMKLLQHQESLHLSEVERWRKAIGEAAGLLRKAEEVLRELHSSIPTQHSNKVHTLLKQIHLLYNSQEETEAERSPSSSYEL